MLSVWLIDLFPSQRLQLGILVVSLEDHSHVAALLGYSSVDDGSSTDADLGSTMTSSLSRDLMHTLLANLGFYAVSTFRIGYCFFFKFWFV